MTRDLPSDAPRFSMSVFGPSAAAGLRISEAVRLTIPAIDRQRMVLRVEQGKRAEGPVRDAVTPAAGHLARLVAGEPIPALALPRRSPGTPHHYPLGEQGLPAGPSAIPHRETPHTPFAASRVAVHLLEAGTNVRTIQLLPGHRSLATTARYLCIATTTICSTSSPLDLLPRPGPPAATLVTPPAV